VLHHSAEVVLSGDGGAVTTQVRLSYRILTPEGEDLATLSRDSNQFHKVEDVKGWLIPSGGSTEDPLQIGCSRCSLARGVDLLEQALRDYRGSAIFCVMMPLADSTRAK